MAKSGFVPAWMKIQSSDKTNGNQKLNIERSNSNIRQSQALNRSETNSTSSSPSIITGRQRHHSSDVVDHATTRHSSFYHCKTLGQNRNRSNDQPISNDVDRQSENIFSFSSSQTQSRRSYSRERLVTNAFAKNSEFNDNNESYNGYRSINSSQRRLHSISSYPNDRHLSNTHHNSTNGNSDRTLNYINDDRERTYGNNDQNLDLTIKPNDNDITNQSSGFDRHEQDFPSLNGYEKNKSSIDDQSSSSSIWKNAASKLRSSHNDTFKLLDRSLSNSSNNSRLFGSNRILARKDRLLSTPNGINGTIISSTSNINRSAPLDLQTNCKTQTKNLDKRSDFFNSLKNDSTNERKNKNGNKRQCNESNKSVNNSDKNHKTSKGTLLLLSVPETPEEKELLTRMGWKENDEPTYEITDEDKEEYEKRIQLSPKSDSNTSAALMSALNRRALPCINIRDVLRHEMIGSTSDDDDDDEDNSNN